MSNKISEKKYKTSLLALCCFLCRLFFPGINSCSGSNRIPFSLIQLKSQFSSASVDFVLSSFSPSMVRIGKPTLNYSEKMVTSMSQKNFAKSINH